MRPGRSFVVACALVFWMAGVLAAYYVVNFDYFAQRLALFAPFFRRLPF
jgi:hypothetical protein